CDVLSGDVVGKSDILVNHVWFSVIAPADATLNTVGRDKGNLTFHTVSHVSSINTTPAGSSTPLTVTATPTGLPLLISTARFDNIHPRFSTRLHRIIHRLTQVRD